MRVFIAIALPDPVLEKIREVRNRIKRYGFKIRWVRTGNIHLTLKFLGEVSPDRIGDIGDAMHGAVRRAEPFTLCSKGVGAFPGIKRPRVLWTGSIINRVLKGHAEYIQPLREPLERSGFDTDFMLVDSYGSSKKSQAEMVDWYNTGTIYVCASASEGTPNVALEAAACGCALVTTPVGNMPDLIRPGHNGVIVDRSVEAIYAGILYAHENYLTPSERLTADMRSWDWASAALSIYDAMLPDRVRLPEVG